jgi:hypothetical protein
MAPDVLAKRLLVRLGDRRFVTDIHFGPPPPITFQHRGYWRNALPPKDALWAYITAPLAQIRDGDPEGVSRYEHASWEAELVRRALRDELYAAGGAPLVGSTVPGSTVSAR